MNFDWENPTITTIIFYRNKSIWMFLELIPTEFKVPRFIVKKPCFIYYSIWSLPFFARKEMIFYWMWCPVESGLKEENKDIFCPNYFIGISHWQPSTTRCLRQKEQKVFFNHFSLSYFSFSVQNQNCFSLSVLKTIKVEL